MIRRPVPLGVLALALAPAVVAAADPAAAVFAPGKVWDVRVTLSAKEFEAMQPRGKAAFPGFGQSPPPPKKVDDTGREQHRNTFGMDLPWATGTVTIGGETFQNVGLRYKGNGTIGDAANTIKKSLKIDLDHFGGAAAFHGLKTLNLHCGVTDPSKLREALAYDVYRAAGVPAPRTAWAEVRLTVPGKHDNVLLGLYTLVEPVDKGFLKDRFSTGGGLLMKPEQVREVEYLGDDWAKYTKRYAPRRDATPAEAKRVIAFAKLVHKADDATFRKEIGSYLDPDAYLRFLAATMYVANSDSFFALGHNYYLYLHPTTGRFHFVPWDVDRAWANFPIHGSNNRQMDQSFTKPYATHKLTDRLLATPGMADQYRRLLTELAATKLSRDALQARLTTFEAATKESFDRDAKAAAARKDGVSAFMAMSAKPPALKTFIEKRTASLAAQLAGRSAGHVPGGMLRIGDFMAEPVVEGWDADKDGKLSRTEWDALVNRVWAACKPDDKGRVTEKALSDGLNTMFPAPPPGSPPNPGMGAFMAGLIVKRADADSDGSLTRAELTAAAGKLFAEFDKAKAGALAEPVVADLFNQLFLPVAPPPPAAKK